MAPGPLDGCRVAVTREHPGRLAELLVAAGADVLHLPLIEVVDTEVERTAVRTALADPAAVDWVLVTSPAGAERVAGPLAVPGVRSAVRVGAVGTATAARIADLTGTPPELVPDRQLAAALADGFVTLHRDRPRQRVVVALADRAAGELADRLRSAGHDVVEVVAYRTVLRRPTEAELERLVDVDAVVFASGSAATAWAQALGDRPGAALPPIVVAIGPTTAEILRNEGLKVTSVAADHSVSGIVEELTSVWRMR